MPSKNELTSTKLANEFGNKQPTSNRYSFMNRGGLRMDDIYQSQFSKIRIISYIPKSKQTEKVRDEALEKGLVLGNRQDSDSGFQEFRIPTSARPFIYDKSLRTSDDLAYTDDNMFLELGQLLKKLADQGAERPLELRGDIGEHIALLEFTRPDEPKLLFVPGFEEHVGTGLHIDHLTDSYGKRIHDEFGERFMNSAESFIRGFSS